MKDICQTRVCCGYRRVPVLLKRDGWPVNPKRIYRLNKEMDLQLRNKVSKCRVKAKLRTDRTEPIHSNHVWAMNFVHDQLATGHKPRVLTVVGTVSRFSPAVDARFNYKSEDVVQALEWVCRQVGYLVSIRVNNGSDSKAERRIAAIMLLTLALWATDSLHEINPAWIDLGTAVILMLPKIGIVPPNAFKASANFDTILFVAGALALGAAVNASGLGAIARQFLERWLPLREGREALNFLSPTLMSLVTGLFTTVADAPAMLTPIAKDLAASTGFSLEAVLMTQVIGFSTVLFPYQVAPLVVAMQLSGEKLAALPRVLIPLTVLTLVALVPLDYLWWRLLGWF